MFRVAASEPLSLFCRRCPGAVLCLLCLFLVLVPGHSTYACLSSAAPELLFARSGSRWGHSRRIFCRPLCLFCVRRFSPVVLARLAPAASSLGDPVLKSSGDFPHFSQRRDRKPQTCPGKNNLVASSPSELLVVLSASSCSDSGRSRSGVPRVLTPFPKRRDRTPQQHPRKK